MSPADDDRDARDAPDRDDVRDDVCDELVARADLDGLVRLVDDRCTTRDWAGLRRIRDRSRAALASGRQLWPAATLAEYRLALWAPPAWAVEALADDSGRFTIGPLSEVIAQHHAWDDLAGELERSPSAALRARYVAHERALRGDTPDEGDLARFPPVIEIPARRRAWEPDYPLATYGDHAGTFPAPPLPGGDGGRPARRTELDDTSRGTRVEVLDDPEVDAAVRHLFEPWVVSGNGRVETVCVAGDAADAVAALGVRRGGLTPVDASTALAWLGWGGASGGSHGRRRGAAAGRDGAWWVLGALGDLHDEWPPSDAAVEDLLADLSWWWWDAGEPVTGWAVRLAVADTAERVAWAIQAVDAA